MTRDLGPIGPHAPADDVDVCCAARITCAACGRPIRPDRGRWRADIDGRGAELACYPEAEGR